MSNVIHIEWDERRAIRFALDQDGMTAAELAERIGMNPSKLSRIISGEQKKLPIDELRKIAEGQDRPVTYYTEDVEVVVHRLSPNLVHSLIAPLSGRTVDYETNPTVRAHETTDWDHRPIDFYVDSDMLDAA